MGDHVVGLLGSDFVPFGGERQTDEDVNASIKGVGRKVEIALKLRTGTTASNPWIAERLAMGHRNFVSNLIRAAR